MEYQEIKKLIVVPTAPEVESEISIQSQPHKLQKYQEVKKNIPWHGTVVPTASEAETETPIQLQLYKLPKKDMELELRKHIMQQLKRTSLPYELTSEKSDMYNAVQEILDSNKSLLPAHKANLSQAIAIAQSRLQQANLVAAQKLLHTQPTPLSTARFHEYSVQPTRPAWEGSQLPATNYLQKLITLKKKLLSPELKGLLTIPSLSASKVPKSAATEEKVDSMLICGKGYRASRHGLTSSHHS